MESLFYQSGKFENYDSYAEIARDRMSLEEANEIFSEYHDSIDFTEEYLREEFSNLIVNAINYAQMRMNWSLFDRETKIHEDDRRTNLHNKFLNSVERYAGYVKRNGKSIHWFELLGQGIEPEEVDQKRKRIGDWACYIALFVALNNR